MRWAKVAVASGLLMLFVCFGLATHTPISVRVDGRSSSCDDVLSAATLVSGQGSSGGAGPSAARPAEAPVRRACAPRERAAAWALWGGMGLGGLVLLVGWTALRERELVPGPAYVVGRT